MKNLDLIWLIRKMNFMINYGAILEKAAEIADLFFINDDIKNFIISLFIRNELTKTFKNNSLYET